MAQPPGTAVHNMAMQQRGRQQQQQQPRLSMQAQQGVSGFNSNSSPYGNAFAQPGRPPQMMGGMPDGNGSVPKMMAPTNMSPSRPPVPPMIDANGRPIQLQGGPPITTPSPFLNIMRNPGQGMTQQKQLQQQHAHQQLQQQYAQQQLQQQHAQQNMPQQVYQQMYQQQMQPQDMSAMQPQQPPQQPQQQQVFTKSMFQNPQYQVPVAPMMAAIQQPYMQPQAQPPPPPPQPQPQPQAQPTTIIQQQVSPVKWVQMKMLKYVDDAPIKWTLGAANQTDWYRLEDHKTVHVREEGLYSINVEAHLPEPNEVDRPSTEHHARITVTRENGLPLIRTAKGVTHASATVHLSPSDILSVLLETEAEYAEWTIAFMGK